MRSAALFATASAAFIASGVYQFPFSADDKGLAHAVLGGWRANAIAPREMQFVLRYAF